MAYRLNHPSFHLPEARGGAAGGGGFLQPDPAGQQPPLPSPDYNSYLIQTPEGTPNGADGLTPGRQQQQQQPPNSNGGGGASGWEGSEGRLGWDPSMFRAPSSTTPQMPTFLRAPSLGDINRTSLSADTAAAHRAVDEWNRASYDAGAAAVSFGACEGVDEWGWGEQPFRSPSAQHETQESFRAAAAFLGTDYPNHDFTLVPSPPAVGDLSRFTSAEPPHLTRAGSDPTPPSATSHSTPNNYLTGSGGPDSGRSSNGPPSHRPNSAPSSLTPAPMPVAPAPIDMAGPFPGVGRKMPGLYSSSGFDVLGVLARVIAHPTAQQLLGPVDFSCSFIVVDVTKHDFPIAYASPSFSVLTGYENRDIVGRNCRFLQAPDGDVQKGTRRQYTDNVAVSHLHDRFSKRKECQASLINYKRGGTPFLNLVTIVPIARWDCDEIEFLVGFQVDLVEAPNAILGSMKDGTYQVSYQILQGVSRPLPPAGRQVAPRRLRRRRELTAEMRDVIQSSGRESAAVALRKLDRGAVDKADKIVMAEWYKSLAEHTDDFVHVLSLKGQFQYVSPSVRNVLGYEPEDLQSKHITDVCHPADAVSVMRELKESTQAAPYGQSIKTVTYLCRARRKVGGFLWLECTGRLHVEPGKGRKVVILTGRERVLPRLDWSAIGAAGGLGDGQDEGWGMASAEGLILYASPELQDILGAHSADQLLGDSLLEHVPAPLDPAAHDRNVTTMSPSKLQSTAEQTAYHKIQDALGLAARGLPKNSSVTVRHQILLPMAGRPHSAASSSSQPPPLNSSDRHLLLRHEVATTFYAVHLDAPWPDPYAISQESSPVNYQSTSRSPTGSPATDSFPLEERQGPSQRRSKPPPILFQVKVVRQPTVPGQAPAAVPGRQPLAPPSADVFQEISVGRETSWLYETQQLKAINRRLRKEVAAARAARTGQSSPQKDDGGKRKRSSDPKVPSTASTSVRPASSAQKQSAYPNVPPPSSSVQPSLSTAANYQPNYGEAAVPSSAPKLDPRQAYQQSLYRAQSDQLAQRPSQVSASAQPQMYQGSGVVGAAPLSFGQPTYGQPPPPLPSVLAQSAYSGSYAYSTGGTTSGHAPVAQPPRRY